MQKLVVFNSVSLDGFFTTADGDLSWMYKSPKDEEWHEFVAGNAKGGGTLLFGRVTYEMMSSYWPTPMAAQNDPVVAKEMNALKKVVFSRTLDKTTWNNTTLVKTDPLKSVRGMKKESGNGMAVLGSGSIVSLLAQEGLVDEFQLVVHPVIVGKGRSMFEGMKGRLNLKLNSSRTFKNGCVVLSYEPAPR
jgi:dihydrofolate reductase